MLPDEPPSRLQNHHEREHKLRIKPLDYIGRNSNSELVNHPNNADCAVAFHERPFAQTGRRNGRLFFSHTQEY